MGRLAPMMITLALTTGCAQQTADLQQARTGRSVLAEWALLAEMRAQLPAVYVREMREEAESELGTVTGSANTAGTPASRAIAATAKVAGDPPPSLLRARVRAAQAIENGLEAR